MGSGSLNREQIIAAYQMLLGREPEWNGAIDYHIAANATFEIFRENILTGENFRVNILLLLKINMPT